MLKLHTFTTLYWAEINDELSLQSFIPQKRKLVVSTGLRKGGPYSYSRCPGEEKMLYPLSRRACGP